ncbi:MAG: hypothetical protein GC183_02845 [Thiobacillus sp.]|nr:hypothetical protein [Thiobacillus sp.]
MAPAFTRHICVDYSGAQTPEASLKGLRVYCANGFLLPKRCRLSSLNPPRPSIDTPLENWQPKACFVGSCSPIGFP